MNDLQGGAHKFDVKAVLSLVSLLSGPLAVFLIILFYANIPKELQAFQLTYARESTETRAVLMMLTKANEAQTDSLKEVMTLRERVRDVEQVQKQQGTEINRLDARMHKLEDRPSIFGGGKK